MKYPTTLFTLGRILYGLALLGIGVEHFMTAHFPKGLIPMAPLGAVQLGAVYGTGAGLSLASGFIMAGRALRPAGYSLALLLALLLLAAHVPRLVANPADASEWTGALEVLALSSGGLLLAGRRPGVPHPNPSPDEWATPTGRVVFALTLLGFGVLHFLYAGYIATLIPAWIPAPLFWAYFVGVAFLASAGSMLLRWQQRVGAGLLGLLFCLWVLLLHGPRVAASPQVEPEWTSAFVALAMGGIGWLLAGSSKPITTQV